MMRRMTWRPEVLCLVAMVSALTAPVVGVQRVRSDQDILMQLERDWDAAFHRHDVAFIQNILADEFIATYDDGTRADKAKELAMAVEDRGVESSRLDEFTVKTYGDTAVVWFSLHLVGASQGRQLEITLRYIDVWVVREGRWQCVASQSTRVGAPEK